MRAQDLNRRMILSALSATMAAPAFGQTAPALIPPTAPDVLSAPPPDVLKGGFDELDRMTVQVMVNGQGPFSFMVDTGAESSALSVELAEQLGLPMGPVVTIHGVAGALPVRSAIVETLAVGARRLQNTPLPLLTRANIGAAGVLGIDVLLGQRVVLDFRRRLIEVETTPPRREYSDIVVRARSRFGQLVLVDSWVGRRPVMVIIDTGAQTTIGNMAFSHLVRSTDWLLKDGHTDIFSVTGQTTKGDWAVIPTVEVGGFVLNHLPVVFSDLHSFARWRLQDDPALLLGMDVLRQFDSVHIDFARRQVSFRGLQSSRPIVSQSCLNAGACRFS